MKCAKPRRIDLPPDEIGGMELHHITHEPGGVDQVNIPLGGLSDVRITDPQSNDAILYDPASETWKNGPGGGGGGAITITNGTAASPDGTVAYENVEVLAVGANQIAAAGQNLTTLKNYVAMAGLRVDDRHLVGDPPVETVDQDVVSCKELIFAGSGLSDEGGGVARYYIEQQHMAHFNIPLPCSQVPPGPKNLLPDSMYVNKINIISDGAVTGTATGQAFSFAAGGGELDFSPNGAISIGPGDRFTLSITSQGTDGTYLAVSWGLQSWIGWG